jgi:hypothetical protein
MFKKWGAETEDTGMDDLKNKPMDNYENKPKENIMENIGGNKVSDRKVDSGNVNTILKGSKLSGDIHVTCDLELSGDVEGNITSEQDSNIVIKGTCKGNIKTRSKGRRQDICKRRI